ncbi:MAG: hypothetical protein IH945_06940 [Armatimonadetes bacterium]|nr:hypothetical protein [Armatimonadota bacterium]
MPRRIWASIGLVLGEEDSYAAWFREVLDHAGLPYREIDRLGFEDLGEYDVVLLAGDGSLNRSQRKSMAAWLDSGGSLVVCGSTWSLEELLGVCEADRAEYSRGWLTPPATEDRLWPEGADRTLFFGGRRIEAQTAAVAAWTEDGCPAVTRNGRCTYVTPHVGKTLALMYLGRSVESDAIGPGDGSVYLEDGVLRAEDGTNLSYEDDREIPEGCEVPIFARAHADAIRELWVRAVYEAVEGCGRPAFATWHWPEDADAVASVSIDCDTDGPEEIRKIYKSMANYGMRATWLAPSPGLPGDVYRQIRQWGHTPGLLYQPDTGDEPLNLMRLQHMQISRGAGTAAVPCVRSEGGQWHGLTSFYEAVEDTRAGLSLSKGGVQPGSAGFLFGSCHMHFPVTPGGRRLEVAELPYAVCEPGLVTEAKAMQTLIDEVVRRRGCLHLRLVLSHAAQQELLFQDALMLIRQVRMRQFSPERLFEYEKMRRVVRVRGGAEGLNIVSNKELPGLTLMVFGAEHEAVVAGRIFTPMAVKRYGTVFSSFVMNLEQKEQLVLQLETQRAVA